MAALAVILQDRQYVFIKGRWRWRSTFLNSRATEKNRKRNDAETADSLTHHVAILQGRDYALECSVRGCRPYALDHNVPAGKMLQSGIHVGP
jgi:hypothetical protein